MMNLYLWLASRAKSEEGAALAEYGLLIALIAVICIAAVTLLGQNVMAALNAAAGAI